MKSKKDKVETIVEDFRKDQDEELLMNAIISYGYECYWEGRREK
jgi:CRISPR/Cas system-associated endonuclease Cas1